MDVDQQEQSGSRSPDPKPSSGWAPEDVPDPLPSDERSEGCSPCPVFKDMATWTVEDDMPSPMDSSTPLDSPDLSQLRRFQHFQQSAAPAHHFESPKKRRRHAAEVQSPAGPYTITSQLQTREARLYENVPTTQSGMESLGMLLLQDNSAQGRNYSNQGGGGNNSEFLNVSELMGPGGPPSRSSWVDSGRESLSFENTPDNSNSNNSNSSKNLLLYPTPAAAPSNSSFSQKLRRHGKNSSSSSSGGGMSRRERLVHQKHAIEESFSPIPLVTSTASPTGSGGLNSMCSYLAVPSPRRGVLSSGLASNTAMAAASPISLHRHPNAQQLLHENKKTRSLIPGCESPYAFNSGDRRATHGATASGYSQNDRVASRLSRSPSRGHTSASNGNNGGSTRYHLQGGHHQRYRGGTANQSFDYGELPSHQMFPKRHLLSGRQFAQPYGNHGSSSNHGNGNGCPPPVNPLNVQAQPHRSFPAGVLSGVAPRSCSMGDLTGGASPRKSHDDKLLGYDQQTVPISNTPAGIHPSLITSLPLPPATSVTYEFSLAPVTGTLAPGWHLTAVQRGLATAVPLAAVVARRRLPRPRPPRQRFGFTDKNEARRAKWTIAVTALGLLAMSMLLVGITLRLAPLIDDLVRKENEDLLRMAQPASGLNITTTSMPFSAAAPLDTGDQSTSINNRTEGTAAGQGALTSNLQPPRQRALTTMLARLLQSSSAISTTIPPNTNTASNSARKYNKIASLTLKHPKNNTKTWSGTLPSSSPEPVAQKASIILEQLMMGHASYYETPRQVQNKELHPKNDRASETSIEDHDEAPPIILAAVVA